jgi:hypothetical protein
MPAVFIFIIAILVGYTIFDGAMHTGDYRPYGKVIRALPHLPLGSQR